MTKKTKAPAASPQWLASQVLKDVNRYRTAGPVNDLGWAQLAVKVVVDSGSHHTGKQYSEMRPLAVLKHAAMELIELAAVDHEAHATFDEAVDELADIFIALFHFKYKRRISDFILSRAIIRKMLLRSELPAVSQSILEGMEAQIALSPVQEPTLPEWLNKRTQERSISRSARKRRSRTRKRS